MASDLPDAHSTPLAMARVLVTYMDDPVAIRKAIKLEFDSAPAHRTISHMRQSYLADRASPPEPPHKAHEGYYPLDASKGLEATNKRFLIALQRERDYAGALNSTYLTRPAMVNHQFDREVDAAVREAMA